MKLHQHYREMWNQSKPLIRSNRIIADSLMDDLSDDRLGITLIARPDARIRQEIDRFLEELRNIEPGQYYYPAEDLHITIMSIISCFPGFTLDQIKIDEYAKLVNRAREGIGAIRVDFSGITASPSSVLIRGYPKDIALEKLRDNLRETIGKSDLEHSMDSRYRIITAHCTSVRFRKPLRNPKQFLSFLQAHFDREFGKSVTTELELVVNDWYMRKDRIGVLERFILGE